MRDKLIRLLNVILCTRCSEDECANIADLLIANGMVVQEQGQWSKVSGGRIICKHCGEYPLYDYFGRQKFSNYCPRCGVKMEGIANGNG